MNEKILKSVFAAALALCAGAARASFTNLVGATGTSVEALPKGYLDPNVADDGESNAVDRLKFWYSGAAHPATVTAYATGEAYAYTAANPRAAVLAGAEPTQTKYLELDLADGCLERAIVPRASDATGESSDFAGVIATNGVWVDTLVRFTATADAPVFEDSDRIVVWARDDSESGGGVSLVVSAGYRSRGGRDVAVRHYPAENAVQVDTWYRLTIRNIGDMSAGGAIPGFVVYLDGRPVVCREDEYDIGQKSGLAATFFNAEARLLVSERRLFPSVVKYGSNDAAVMTRLAVTGVGAIDDVSFCSTNALPFLTSRTVLTVSWDFGVASLKYVYRGVTNDIALAGNTNRFVDISLGDVLEGDVEMVATYKTELTYKRGDWTGENGCTAPASRTETVFSFAGGGRNPVANVRSMRDFIELGEGADFNTFVNARAAARKKGGVQTIALGTNFTPTVKSVDRGYIGVTYQDDLILDLQGHTLTAGTYNYATVVNASGRLRIIDSTGSGSEDDPLGDEKGAVNAYTWDPVSNVLNTLTYEQNGALYERPYAKIAVRNVATAGKPSPSLVIEGGRYNGIISLESGPTNCVIAGGHYYSADSNEFYLAESVTNTMHWAWNEPYWDVGKGYNIRYVGSDLWTAPTNFIKRYTKDTRCTPLPIPHLDYHEFKGWWMTNNLFVTVGKGSGPTNSPYGDLLLTPHWKSAIEPDSFVWTGLAAPDSSWFNPTNWDYEGYYALPTSATDKVIFPLREGTAWSVDIGDRAVKPLNWYVYGPVSLTGTNGFDDVVLHGTNTLNGTALLLYGARPPTNLGKFLGKGWKGTVWISNVTERAELADIATWGSSGSKVIFNGVYGNYTNRVARIMPYTLVLEDYGDMPAWKTDAGFTGNTLDFACLTGSGTLISTNVFRRPTLQVLKFRDVMGYSGRIHATSKRFVFGTALPANTVDATATFAPNVSVPANNDWTFSNVVCTASFYVDGGTGSRICKYYGNADISACSSRGTMNIGGQAGHLEVGAGWVCAVTDSSSALSSAAVATSAGAPSGGSSASSSVATGSAGSSATATSSGAVIGSSSASGQTAGATRTSSSASGAGTASGTASGTTVSSGATVSSGSSVSSGVATSSSAVVDATSAVVVESGTASNAVAWAGASTVAAVPSLMVVPVTEPLTGKVSFVGEPLYASDFLRVSVTGRVDNTDDNWVRATGWSSSNGLKVKMFFALTNPDGTVITNAMDQKAAKGYYQRSTTYEDIKRGETYVLNCWVTTPEQSRPIGWAEGRLLTVGNSETYIAETADTFANPTRSTGTWTDVCGIASAEDGVIRIDADLIETPDATLHFAPTVSESFDHNGYVTSFRVKFDDVADKLPDTDALYGITLVENEDGEACFAVLESGAWTLVPTSVIAPTFDAEYLLSVKVDEQARTVRYFVAPPDGLTVELGKYTADATASVGPGDLDFTGNGALRAVDGVLCDRDTYKLSLSIDPSTRAGTNFVAAGVVLSLDFQKKYATESTYGLATVVAKDQMGNVVATRNVTFDDNRSGPLAVTLDGLDAGAGYTYEASVKIGDGETYDAAVTASGAMVLANLRQDWNWVAENGDTFEGSEEGTGVWSKTNGVAYAIGTAGSKSIAVRTEYADDAISFAPSAWPKRDEISLYELRTYVNFQDADALPAAPGTSVAWGGYAMTYAADEGEEVDGEFALAILHGGAWEKVPRTTFAPEIGVDYAMSAVVDVWNSNVCYYVTTPEQVTTCLAQLSLPKGLDPMFATVDLHGDVTVRALTGEYYDPNLARDPDGKEYLSFVEGVEARDEHDAITPLWYCTYELTRDHGRFTVTDPNGYLNVLRGLGYYVTVKDLGDSTSEYSYSMSDNWIDYADYAEVYEGLDGRLHVTAEEGLSYVALLARDGSNYLGRTVILDHSLTNLALHGWTPISGFAGTFDGAGYELRGLKDHPYLSSVTNDVGCWGFGLFNDTGSAEFRNVLFSDVSIRTPGEEEGLAFGDGVGALVGNAHGDLVVSNVWVKSGSVTGADAVGGVVGRADNAAVAPSLAEMLFFNVTNEAVVAVAAGGYLTGTKAAGLLGYADGYSYLTLDHSANAGTVTQAADLEDVATYTAGLATFAGGTNWSSSAYNVIVTGSANLGDISTRVFRLAPAGSDDPTGGNVAQLFCNASDRDIFGSVTVSGNLADGTIDAELVYNDDRLLDAWPVGNFASSVATYDSEGYYKFFIEATDPSAVVLDPVYHTARMSQARFENDFVNTAGCVNDRITASSEPARITLGESIVTWEEIVCDRNAAINLNGKFVEATFYNAAFHATAGATVVVSNGVIYAEEGLWYAVDAGATITFKDVTFAELGGDSIVMNGITIKAGELVTLGRTDYDIEIPSASNVTVDDAAKTVSCDGVVVGRFANYYDISSTTEGDVTKVTLTLNALALPSLGGSLASPSSQSLLSLASSAALLAAEAKTPAMVVEDGLMKVNALNTRTGLWYGLQYTTSVGGAWKPVVDWHAGSDGESVRLTAPAATARGLYRIEVTDHEQ